MIKIPKTSILFSVKKIHIHFRKQNIIHFDSRTTGNMSSAHHEQFSLRAESILYIYKKYFPLSSSKWPRLVYFLKTCSIIGKAQIVQINLSLYQFTNSEIYNIVTPKESMPSPPVVLEFKLIYFYS